MTYRISEGAWGQLSQEQREARIAQYGSVEILTYDERTGSVTPITATTARPPMADPRARSDNVTYQECSYAQAAQTVKASAPPPTTTTYQPVLQKGDTTGTSLTALAYEAAPQQARVAVGATVGFVETIARTPLTIAEALGIKQVINPTTGETRDLTRPVWKNPMDVIQSDKDLMSGFKLSQAVSIMKAGSDIGKAIDVKRASDAFSKDLMTGKARTITQGDKTTGITDVTIPLDDYLPFDYKPTKSISITARVGSDSITKTLPGGGNVYASKGVGVSSLRTTDVLTGKVDSINIPLSVRSAAVKTGTQTIDDVTADLYVIKGEILTPKGTYDIKAVKGISSDPGIPGIKSASVERGLIGKQGYKIEGVTANFEDLTFVVPKDVKVTGVIPKSADLPFKGTGAPKGGYSWLSSKASTIQELFSGTASQAGIATSGQLFPSSTMPLSTASTTSLISSLKQPSIPYAGLPKTSTIIKIDTALKSDTKIKTDNQIKERNPIYDIRMPQPVKQDYLKATEIKSDTPIKTETITSSITTPKTDIPGIPTPPIPPAPKITITTTLPSPKGGFGIPPALLFGGRGGYSMPSRPASKAIITTKYNPSFSAAVFGIKSTKKRKSRGYTGLEARPLIITSRSDPFKKSKKKRKNPFF